MALKAEAGLEAGQHQRRLWYGERAAHVDEVGQLFVCLHHLDSPEVYAPQHYVRLAARAYVCLQRRLAVEFDCQVDDVAPLHEAEWRRVCPSSGDVDAHGAARPHYLVGVDRQPRLLPVGQHGLREPLAQQAEGAPTVSRTVAAGEPKHLRAEHGVVNPRHERCLNGQRRRQFHAATGKLARRVVEVGLVENAVFVVTGQCRPVVPAVAAALLYEPGQVGLVGYFLGTHEPAALWGGPSGEHGCQHAAHLGHVGNHRELPSLLLLARKLVADAVGAHGKRALAHRHNVDALARAEGYVPVVAGHPGDDVVVAYRPAGAHMAVLYPQVGVLGRDGYLGDGVLYEYRRVRLAPVVHYLPLVVDNVLYGLHRRNHLAARAEVVELTAGQRHHGHA